MERNRHTVMQTLVRHFFRRFFDNDTVHVQGDTTTTVARALAAVSVPGLMVAFFMQTQYQRRAYWGAIGDQYLFVLFSFVVMGAVAIVEWEMLFPDRSDFLVLTPLSLKSRQMLAAKALALCGFLFMFLVATNVFGAVMLPLVSKIAFWRQVWAHSVATLLAGQFAALALLGLGGTMLCVLDPRRFRLASPLLQMGTVIVLMGLLLQFLRFGETLPVLLAEPLGWARWVPQFWFLGVYEKLLHGDAAPAFAADLARCAYRAVALAAAVVVVTYPLAWARMQRVAIEGINGGGKQPWAWWTRVVAVLVPRPAERAVFHFIGQTVARNARYQVYLAIYGGLGIALALGCGVDARGRLSDSGLYAVLPLAVFWAVLGLRSAFAFPLNLGAGWVFRLSGAQATECGAAARRWGLGFAWVVTAAVAGLTVVAGWDWRRVLVQVVFGGCLGVLLTDLFFASNDYVPFNRVRMPGQTNFPAMLTLYVGVLPVYVVTMMRVEVGFERHLFRLAMVGLGTMAVHWGVGRLRQEPGIVEEDLEGYDEGFQLLGLS